MLSVSRNGHFLPPLGCLFRPRRNSCHRTLGSFWPGVCSLCPQDSWLYSQPARLRGPVMAQSQARRCAGRTSPSAALVLRKHAISFCSSSSFFLLTERDLRNNPFTIPFNKPKRGYYCSRFTQPLSRRAEARIQVSLLWGKLIFHWLRVVFFQRCPSVS